MSKNIFSLIVSDINAAKKRDPAARSVLEIIFTYSGFHAILGYRFSNILWKIKLKFLARFLSNLFRIITSIEIHPGCTVGEGFFIDHGAGLVIGETSIIRNNVTMYQQVTLGGISPSINSFDQKNVKRHPTIEDRVIIGSGAQILGPISIGENSRIGANAVVLQDVPANQTFIGVPARRVSNLKKVNEFEPYGITEGKIDDPNKKSILVLLNDFHELGLKMKKIEHDLSDLTKKKNSLKNFLIKKNVELKNFKKK